jgi:hypothetical protein
LFRQRIASQRIEQMGTIVAEDDEKIINIKTEGLSRRPGGL